MHDSLIDTIQDTLTYISEKLGEESIEDVWRYLAQISWQSAIQMFKDMDHDKMTKQIAAGHRAHGSECYVEQDGEKTVFVVTSCGAGGKLRKEGKLDYTDRHPRSGGATKKPDPWSCDQTGVPYYCVHTPVMFNILPKEWGLELFEYQWGRQFDDDGNPVGDLCRQVFYRNPRSS